MRRGIPILVTALLLLGAAPRARAQKSDVEEAYNPYLAERSLEVGEFYLKKKNYDAAISRLLECISYKPNYAKPHLLLGLAYEKKREYGDAIEYYSKYLEILPQAEDAPKVRKRIEKLKRKLAAQEKRRKRSS